MQKILVIGCPGSGKSTFARKLRDKTNLPLYHLDMLWHKPDKTNISQAEFDKKLLEILQKDGWIIDGNFSRTMETRFKYCDKVFLLDYPLEVCLEGVQSRIGTQREDMPWMETEFDPEFKEFIIGFRNNRLPEIYKLTDKYKDKLDVTIFKSRQQADRYIENFDNI